MFAALVFLGTVLLYMPSARYAFVDHDDPEYVIENPNMRDGLTWGNIKWAFTSVGYANNWHPLAWISMMADVTLAGPLDDESWNRRDNRVAHVMHLHNILLHAANAVLLFFLLGLFLGGDCDFRGDVLRLLLALFWAVHPLRCEVVCWCSERKELTCVFFMLSSLCYGVYSRKFLLRTVFCQKSAGKSSSFTEEISFFGKQCSVPSAKATVTLPSSSL